MNSNGYGDEFRDQVDVKQGNLYTVDLLPDEADFLDWDKPLSEQPAIAAKLQIPLRDLDAEEALIRKANELGVSPESLPEYNSIVAALNDQRRNKFGQEIYEMLAGETSPQAASARLAALGIPGIKYLDAGSRSAGEGSRNYVIFDDKLVKIIEENGKPVGEPASTKRFQPVSPEQDAAYLRAAQAGDIETARKLVIEAAKNADYFSHGDFRDAHRAPSGPAGTNADVMNGDAEPTLIQVAKGVHNQPSDYFDPRVGPRYYMYQDKAGMESLRALRTAMDKIQQGKKASVTVFRAVPIEIKGTKLENKDWVTPSKTYAISHGEARFGEGQYRIIKESVKAENLFWDGNDIREWGKDDSQDYFYRNVKNNIKSADPITYDDAGNIIPLSQRFNVESPDIRFQPDAASPSILNGSNGTRIIKSPSGKFRIYSATGTLMGIRDTEQAAQKLATK